MVSTALVLLAGAPPPPVGPVGMAVPVVLMIAREITMSALREWAAASGGGAHKAVKVNSLGKWKTALQVGALAGPAGRAGRVRGLCRRRAAAALMLPLQPSLLRAPRQSCASSALPTPPPPPPTFLARTDGGHVGAAAAAQRGSRAGGPPAGWVPGRVGSAGRLLGDDHGSGLPRQPS